MRAVYLSFTRGMTRDETTYNSPEEFHPERFQDLHNSVTEVIDPRRIVFGFGRRCVTFWGESSQTLKCLKAVPRSTICRCDCFLGLGAYHCDDEYKQVSRRGG